MIVKTTLVMKSLRIECTGNATFPISDYVKARVEKAHSSYNGQCDAIKATYTTTLPAYPDVESQWFRLQDWLGVYNVVKDVINGHQATKKTFPNKEGYIEVMYE